MTNITNRDQAVSVAKAHRRKKGYREGAYLGAKQICSNENKWEVEFAHYGLTERSPTTDPESIRLEVDLTTKEVKSIDLM